MQRILLSLIFIPDGTTFIPNSVTINGSTHIELDPNTGITIPSIAPNNSISIAFQVTATSTPNQNPVANSATVYTFIADPMHRPFQETLLQTQCLLRLIQLTFFH